MAVLEKKTNQCILMPSLLPLGGATLFQVLSSLPSVTSIPLLDDSRGN